MADHDPTLTAFLRAHRATIVERWADGVREIAKARALTRPALIDHIPALLDAIGTFAEKPGGGALEAFPEGEAIAHALQRLDFGFDLEEVTHEYGVLRRTILDLLHAHAVVLRLEEMQVLNGAIDAALGRSVAGYAHSQQRILRAVDRVTEATLTVTSIEDLLSQLLQVFAETAAAVDSVVLLLREGNRLRVRASVGTGSPGRGTVVVLSEGFAGRIATDRRPVAIDDAASHPQVDERLRATGVLALYGVPLIHGGDLLGVAYMGSRSASAFSHEQQIVFRTMASRATLLIAHALAVARDRAAGITARALAVSTTVDEAGTRLLADIGEVFGWQTGVYWRLDAGVLRYRGSWTAPGVDFSRFHESSRRFEFEMGAGLPGRAWQSGGVEWVASVEKDPALPRKELAMQDGLRSAVAFPLSTGEETLGVLEFFSETERERVEEAVEMTGVMARQLPEFIRRVHAQEMLQRSEAQKSAMLAVALDCVITMDAEGRVTGWNPAAEGTFGYTAEEALGRELAELIVPPELRSSHRSGVARYLASGQTRYLNRRIEVPALRQDGTRIVVELAITRVPVEGPALFTGYLRDITGRKQTEQEQARLYRAAEEASRMRERLLAIVAHDLRNPLGATMSAAALLLRTAGTDPASDVHRRLRAILRASGQMDRLIADLLDTANIHRGQLSIEPRPHELAAILAEAQELHQAAAAEKGLRLEVQTTPGDLQCVCDRGRIVQVLSNIVGNAIRFCRTGDSIFVRASAAGGDALIEVADTGPGIAAADLPLIFEPYWSGRRDRSDGGTRSTGLGLFISKGIVEAHGGTLWAESEPGRGSTFRFTLPSP